MKVLVLLLQLRLYEFADLNTRNLPEGGGFMCRAVNQAADCIASLEYR